MQVEEWWRRRAGVAGALCGRPGKENARGGHDLDPFSSHPAREL